MCRYCKCDAFRPNVDTFVANDNGKLVIIKDVPCLECEQCGEKYYTDDVTRKLYQIAQQARSQMQKLSILNYSVVA